MRSAQGGLVEAVPNFSAGRDAAVVDRLAAASSMHAPLLDVHSDSIHNRTVITLAGFEEHVAEALFAGAAAAVELVDLRRHLGVHPRVGAADVLPIVPLADTSPARCVELAGALGARIWTELRVPVYFYGAASSAGVTLAEIRTGRVGYAIGDSAHPTAGASCIGVRTPLIAYNVTLPGASLTHARQLARTIRESSGGLPGVRALAFDLGGDLVQVSMNLVQPDRTPPAVALQAIHDLCRGLGLEVGADELVGLCPARHANASAAGRVFEARMAAAAIEAGAVACRRRLDDEHVRLADSLDRGRRQLAATGYEPAELISAAEVTAAARRTLRVAGCLDAQTDALLRYAAPMLRESVADAPGEFAKRLRALDAWLEEL